MTKVRTLIATATLLMLGSGSAMAQLSANIGVMSDYIFRGIYQEDTSAFAGLDYESDSGFYIGTWGADVGDGLETDLYFGYGGGNDDFSWSVGYTGYYYTDDWDDTYEEINLGIGASGFALDVAIGEYDNFDDPTVDYTYIAASYTLDMGTSFTLARLDAEGYTVPGTSFVVPDSDGMWLEISHGFEIANDTEIGVTFLYSPDADDSNTTIAFTESGAVADNAIVLSITKSISIGN